MAFRFRRAEGSAPPLGAELTKDLLERSPFRLTRCRILTPAVEEDLAGSGDQGAAVGALGQAGSIKPTRASTA